MLQNRDEDRALVERALRQEWGEPSVAVHIGRFQPAFRVPGRRLDGSDRSANRARRFFAALLRAPGRILGVAADVVANSSPGVGSPNLRSGQVRGSEDSSAVRFAAAACGEFWLVISASHLAAVKTGSSPRVVTLWSAGGAQRPQLDREAAALRWPDGSSVSFRPESAERQRLGAV